MVSVRHTSDFPAFRRRTESGGNCPLMANAQIADGPSSGVHMEEPNKYAFPDASHEVCQPCGCPFLLLTGGLTFACFCHFLWSPKGEGCGEGRQSNVLPQRTTEAVMEPKERRTKRNWKKKIKGAFLGEKQTLDSVLVRRNKVWQRRRRTWSERRESHWPACGFRAMPVDVLWMSWSTQLQDKGDASLDSNQSSQGHLQRVKRHEQS